MPIVKINFRFKMKDVLDEILEGLNQCGILIWIVVFFFIFILMGLSFLLPDIAF